MRRFKNFEHRPWFILPVVPHIERRYRRWDVALISALIFIVIGVFVMTMTPELGHAGTSTSSASQKVPVPSGANHAD
jgi:hypothetical protein